MGAFRGIVGLRFTGPEVDVVYNATKMDKSSRTMDYDHFVRALKAVACRKYPWKAGDPAGPAGTKGEAASMARLVRHFWHSGDSSWRRVVRSACDVPYRRPWRGNGGAAVMCSC